MPHVVIHCFKADIPSANLDRIKNELTRVLQQQLGCAPAAVSIDLQLVEPARWAEQVYRPLIHPHLNILLKRPSYSC